MLDGIEEKNAMLVVGEEDESSIFEAERDRLWQWGRDESSKEHAEMILLWPSLSAVTVNEDSDEEVEQLLQLPDEDGSYWDSKMTSKYDLLPVALSAW